MTINEKLEVLANTRRREEEHLPLISKSEEGWTTSNSGENDLFDLSEPFYDTNWHDSEEEANHTKTPNYRWTRTTCGKALWDLAHEIHPELKDDTGVRNVYFSMGLRPYRTSDGDISAWGAYLAHLEGKTEGWKSNNYVSSTTLERLRPLCKTLSYTEDWSKKEGRSRVITELEFVDEISDAFDRELNTTSLQTGKRVYCDTGEVVTRAKLRAQRESYRTDAMRCVYDAPNEASRRVLTYMITLPQHGFSKMLRHTEEAIQVTNSFDGKNARRIARQSISTIQDYPQPMYRLGKNEYGSRLFPYMQGLLTVNSAVRRVFTQDWPEFDLVASQLALIARYWEVDMLFALLESDESIWAVLLREMGIKTVDPARFEEHKKPLKTATYSVAYGMGPKRLRKELNESVLAEVVDDPGARFLALPLVRELLKVRKRELDRIIQQRGATDCFGNWIPLGPSPKGGPNHRMILALCAQARELDLLQPVFYLAKEKGDFKIMIWQHDGFCVAFDDASKKERRIRQIVKAVNAKAEGLGIPTVLEVK